MTAVESPEAADGTARLSDFRGSVTRLLSTMGPDRPLLVLTVLCGITGIALTVLGPALLGRATDLIVKGMLGGRLPEGLTRSQASDALRRSGNDGLATLVENLHVVPGTAIDFDAVGTVLLWALLAYAGVSLIGFVQARAATALVQRAAFRLRRDIQEKLSRLPLSHFEGQSRGDLLSRATNDIDNIQQTLQQTLSQILTSLLTLVGVLAMMFWISPLLTLVVLATVPLSVWVAARLGRRAQPQFVRQWQTTGALNSHIEEMYTAQAQVRAFGRQSEAAAAFRKHNDELCQVGVRAQFVSGSIQPAMTLLSNLTYVLVAVIGTLRVVSGTLSIGEVQAFVQYARQFGQPLSQLASVANLLQSGAASAERVFELLDAPEEREDARERSGAGQAGGEASREGIGRVEFQKVSFRYAEDRPLIHDLTLSVPPGRTVAVVGPTGAGKTTLVNLLLRFHEVQGGRITLDGTDISTMSRARLRSRIGTVLQDTWLFGGTVAENIAYGAPDATQDEIVEAARATQVDRFVRTLPEGYDTVLDEEGSNISAGGRQLITIARAFLAKPTVLVLDEATSQIDPRTELQIQRAMARLRAGRTSFVIAHRLSTIRDADTILVLDNGAVVEQGTHDTLVSAGGTYARLYGAQFTELTGAPG
ncbi:ABC transporter ATP-binding protein [Streptomyces sp. NPDC048565]|uniref:ABC transporter ATP-binding protein n=1 Tax=Streptomyces sp. NPDC048565 TaxID=3155266 RepID=UPI0034289810